VLGTIGVLGVVRRCVVCSLVISRCASLVPPRHNFSFLGSHSAARLFCSRFLAPSSPLPRLQLSPPLNKYPLVINLVADHPPSPHVQVLQAYEKEGFDMLLKVFNDQTYLEKLSGLDKLAEEGEAALEAVDWDEEGEGEGDDF
jgi:hypothetical protein